MPTGAPRTGDLVRPDGSHASEHDGYVAAAAQRLATTPPARWIHATLRALLDVPHQPHHPAPPVVSAAQQASDLSPVPDDANASHLIGTRRSPRGDIVDKAFWEYALQDFRAGRATKFSSSAEIDGDSLRGSLIDAVSPCVDDNRRITRQKLALAAMAALGWVLPEDDEFPNDALADYISNHIALQVLAGVRDQQQFLLEVLRAIAQRLEGDGVQTMGPPEPINASRIHNEVDHLIPPEAEAQAEDGYYNIMVWRVGHNAYQNALHGIPYCKSGRELMSDLGLEPQEYDVEDARRAEAASKRLLDLTIDLAAHESETATPSVNQLAAQGLRKFELVLPRTTALGMLQSISADLLPRWLDGHEDGFGNQFLAGTPSWCESILAAAVLKEAGVVERASANDTALLGRIGLAEALAGNPVFQGYVRRLAVASATLNGRDIDWEGLDRDDEAAWKKVIEPLTDEWLNRSERLENVVNASRVFDDVLKTLPVSRPDFAVKVLQVYKLDPEARLSVPNPWIPPNEHTGGLTTGASLKDVYLTAPTVSEYAAVLRTHLTPSTNQPRNAVQMNLPKNIDTFWMDTLYAGMKPVEERLAPLLDYLLEYGNGPLDTPAQFSPSIDEHSTFEEREMAAAHWMSGIYYSKKDRDFLRDARVGLLAPKLVSKPTRANLRIADLSSPAASVGRAATVMFYATNDYEIAYYLLGRAADGQWAIGRFAERIEETGLTHEDFRNELIPRNLPAYAPRDTLEGLRKWAFRDGQLNRYFDLDHDLKDGERTKIDTFRLLSMPLDAKTLPSGNSWSTLSERSNFMQAMTKRIVRDVVAKVKEIGYEKTSAQAWDERIKGIVTAMIPFYDCGELIAGEEATRGRVMGCAIDALTLSLGAKPVKLAQIGYRSAGHIRRGLAASKGLQGSTAHALSKIKPDLSRWARTAGSELAWNMVPPPVMAPALVAAAVTRTPWRKIASALIDFLGLSGQAKDAMRLRYAPALTVVPARTIAGTGTVIPVRAIGSDSAGAKHFVVIDPVTGHVLPGRGLVSYPDGIVRPSLPGLMRAKVDAGSAQARVKLVDSVYRGRDGSLHYPVVEDLSAYRYGNGDAQLVRIDGAVYAWKDNWLRRLTTVETAAISTRDVSEQVEFSMEMSARGELIFRRTPGRPAAPQALLHSDELYKRYKVTLPGTNGRTPRPGPDGVIRQNRRSYIEVRARDDQLSVLHLRVKSHDDQLYVVPPRGRGGIHLPVHYDATTKRWRAPSAHNPEGKGLLDRRLFEPSRAPVDYDNALIYSLPAHPRSSVVLDADGDVTVWLDGVAYRVEYKDGAPGILRRVKSGDLDRHGLRNSGEIEIPRCRVARSLDQLGTCGSDAIFAQGKKTLPTPGTFDQEKGYATWFNDVLYTPGSLTVGHQKKTAVLVNGKFFKSTVKQVSDNAIAGPPKYNEKITASFELQKGIYARVRLDGIAEGFEGRMRVGTVLVGAKDPSKRYAVMSLQVPERAGVTRRYYYGEAPLKPDIDSQITMSRSLGETPRDQELMSELRKVYDGSVTANNLASRVDEDTIRQAMDTMSNAKLSGDTLEDYQKLKWLDTDTTPSEALLFDQASRLRVQNELNGKWAAANALSHTGDAGDVTTVANTLFLKDGTAGGTEFGKQMDVLRGDISSLYGRQRNIAFADVTTRSGERIVFVSVSGQRDLTRQLPLFARGGAQNGEVTHAGVKYVNIDHKGSFKPNELSIDPRNDVPYVLPDLSGKPHARAFDTESKLFQYLSKNGPPNIESTRMFTLLPPCNSCALVAAMYESTRSMGDVSVRWAPAAGRTVKNADRTH